jgi:hypothetical protein
VIDLTDQQRRAAQQIDLQRSDQFATILERNGNGRAHVSPSIYEAIEVLKQCRSALGLESPPPSLPEDGAGDLTTHHGDSWCERSVDGCDVSLARVYEIPGSSPDADESVLLVHGSGKPLLCTHVGAAAVSELKERNPRFERIYPCSTTATDVWAIARNMKPFGSSARIAALPIVEFARQIGSESGPTALDDAA